MTTPIPIERYSQVKAESEQVIRRRRFRVRDVRDMVRLMEMLRLEKITGSMTIHCNDGGFNCVVIEERAGIEN